MQDLDQDYYSRLPDDALIAIASNLSMYDLIEHCNASRRFAQLCYNNDFWRLRFGHMFGSNTIDWEEEYNKKLFATTKTQDEWREKYNQHFGDLDYRKRYLEEIANKLRRELLDPSIKFMFRRYSNLTQGLDHIAKLIVNPFINELVPLKERLDNQFVLLIPQFNKILSLNRDYGPEKMSDVVSEAFMVLLSDPKTADLPNLRDTYESMFGRNN